MLISTSTIRKAMRISRTLKKLKRTLLPATLIKVSNYHTCYRETHTVPQNGPWDVLFFGGDDFAVKSLQTLHTMCESKILQRLEVVTVIKERENAIAKYARANGIVINKWPLDINVSKFHIGVVVSFGHLIPSNVIHSFPLGMINVHASLLPRWRGAAPIIYALMNGDTQTGISIMKIMPKKFDIGTIVLQKHIDINEHDTQPLLHEKLTKVAAHVLLEVFENLPQSLQSAVPQNEAYATYAPKITSKISVIKWNEMSAENVYNLHRALAGIYPLVAIFQDRKIKLLGIQTVEESFVGLKQEPPGVVIYDKRNNFLIVKCKGETYISVKRVIIQGRAAMNANDFCNGFIAGKKETKTFFT